MKKTTCGLSALIAFGWITSALSEPTQKFSFNVERKTLMAALTDFSLRTGLQTSFAPRNNAEANLIVGPLKGDYTAEAALEQLLGDSGMTFERINEITYHITSSAGAKAARSGDAAGKEAVSASHAHPKLLHLVDGPNTYAVAAPLYAAAAESTGERFTLRDSSGRVQQLEEVLVTGTHIRGVDNNTVPVVVLDKSYIDASGVTTTARLLEALPQNFALANQAGVSIPGVSGPATQGASINLRGLGEGTTLVLLNGRRLALGFIGSAVDIAALPLSAIERVEVLTDGAAALYGSDAVGGVVNFILRSDFDGAETRLQTGRAAGDVNEYGVSQLLGEVWSSGNALLSLDYYKRDLLRAGERDFVPETSIIGSLLPEDENYALMLTARQELGETMSMFVEGLHTKRDSYHEGGRTIYAERFTTDNPQTSLTLGLDWSVGAEWGVEISGGYAKNDVDTTYDNTLDADAGLGTALAGNRFEIRTGRIKADGPIAALPGGALRGAVGVDWRSESLRYLTRYAAGPVVQDEDHDQTIRSAFAEIYLPLIGADNARAGVQRLEFSAAARLDDYSSFGSSLDPRFGVMYAPVAGLQFRGSYGTSYVAPKLNNYAVSGNGALAYLEIDPESPGGVSHILEVFGNGDDLTPQESKSFSLGFEIAPPALPGFQLGVNYYDIEYTDQIVTPPFPSVILANAASYGSLTIRDPSVAQVNDYIAIGELGVGFFPFDPDFNPDPNFDPSSVNVIVDTRTRNLSVMATNGLDLSFEYGFDGLGGSIQLGVAGTRILELEQRATSTSAPVELVDTFYNPPDWRARGFLGWQRRGWTVNLLLNHTDSYVDNRTETLASVSSYTTVDLHLAYDFTDRFKSGFLSGLTLSLDVRNALDEEPPRTAIVSEARDMGFDPTNADPLGRFIAVEVMKTW